MLTAVIFVCLAGTECRAETAIDVLRTPVESAIPSTCLMQGEAFLAATEIGRTMQDEVARVACVRKERR